MRVAEAANAEHGQGPVRTLDGGRADRFRGMRRFRPSPASAMGLSAMAGAVAPRESLAVHGACLAMYRETPR
ncbi:MAG: hypothetical protein LBR80_06465 [Deltaproteobacteria bacterium]|nr:hypothetical protein [Deltaproteobacteria bacterium]